MDNKFKKITDILDSSELSEQDKNDFLSVLFFVSEQDLGDIVELIEKDKSMETIKMIINNYRVKKRK